jgi:chitodextrinase
MRLRPRTYALLAGVAVALLGALAVPTLGAPAASAATCTAPLWVEGATYTAGTQVTYDGHTYQALVTHTAYVGAGLEPGGHPVTLEGPGHLRR